MEKIKWRKLQDKFVGNKKPTQTNYLYIELSKVDVHCLRKKQHKEKDWREL